MVFLEKISILLALYSSRKNARLKVKNAHANQHASPNQDVSLVRCLKNFFDIFLLLGNESGWLVSDAVIINIYLAVLA